MVTLAFSVFDGATLYYPPGSLHSYGWADPPSKKKYDIISFDDDRESARYCIFSSRKPIKVEDMDKKAHYNFSHWRASEYYLDASMLSQLKDL